MIQTYISNAEEIKDQIRKFSALYLEEAPSNTTSLAEQREIVRQTCETFTRLLLSITPFKAKEFVEKNCARVRRKIMQSIDSVAAKDNSDNDDDGFI